MHSKLHALVRLVVLMALLVPLPAHAYIGPGAGLGAIGTVLAVIGALFLLVVGFVWYPVKRLLRKKKKDQDLAQTEANDSPAGE